MRTSLIAVMLVTWASAALGKEKTDTTWGKPAISYEQYKRDSVDCALRGYYRDVSKDDPAVRFIAGWRAADTALNTAGGNRDSWEDAVRRTQPDRKRAEIHLIQVRDVEDCLSTKGYREIELTPDDTKRLRRYARGSEARRQALYRLSMRE